MNGWIERRCCGKMVELVDWQDWQGRKFARFTDSEQVYLISIPYLYYTPTTTHIGGASQGTILYYANVHKFIFKCISIYLQKYYSSTSER